MDSFNLSGITPFVGLQPESGLFQIQERTYQYLLLLSGVCIAFTSLVQILNSRKLSVNVPSEGRTGKFDLYGGAYRFIKDGRAILLGGYNKYKLDTFKIPGVERWTVIINKQELIEEIRKAPADYFSLNEATSEQFASRWTLGTSVFSENFHVNVVRNQLTRCLTARFDDVYDELSHSFDVLVPAKEDSWLTVPALRTMQKIVCRTSNRIFCGLPLCRDEDYIELNINLTVDVINVSNELSKIPEMLKPIVGPLITTIPKRFKQGMKHLRPILENRFRLYEQYGNDYPNKPADMITWLIEEAPENMKRDVIDLTKRILAINFAAIHTSANSFTHALYHLAAEPDKYVAPLREEVERVIDEEGWTKGAMTKLWKLDSFMKESQRFNGINLLALNRKVLKDYTLSDGTFLPVGTFVAANVTGTHRDSAFYEKPDEFDGFRFANIREGSSEEELKHQMVQTSSDYLAFGHGRLACPGRFFAVNELKAMMAYVLLNYDVKLEKEGIRPSNIYKGIRLLPNPTAKLMFKKRKVA